jgi:hypothetical protein
MIGRLDSSTPLIERRGASEASMQSVKNGAIQRPEFSYQFITLLVEVVQTNPNYQPQTAYLIMTTQSRT